MRRVYLLILILAATAAGMPLTGWVTHAAGGAASAPVETPQRAAQQGCTADDDVSVAISDQWGVVDPNNNYMLKNPPDYKDGDDIRVYYDVTNSSCREVTVTVELKGSVSQATIHDADGSSAPCLDGCTLAAGAKQQSNVQWDLARHPNAKGEKVVATVTIGAPSDFSDADTSNNSATSAQSINIVNEETEPDPAPDIAVKSITPSTTSAVIGETVNFTVTVKNEGDADAESDTTVTLHLGDGTDVLDSDTITALAAGAEGTATLAWDTDDAEAGEHTLRALAQTEGDGNADNDSKTATVTLEEPSVDVAVTSVTASATEAVVGDTVDFTVTLANLGNVVAARPEVSLFDAGGGTDAAPLASETAKTIAVGDETTVTVSWDTSAAAGREYSLRVVAAVDGDDDATNNSATTTLTLHNQVDVSLSLNDDNATTTISGNSVPIGFTVANTGDHAAGEVTVNLHVWPSDGPPERGEPTDTMTIPAVGAGKSATGTLTWDTADVAVGDYGLEVVTETIGDIDETNNSVSDTITIRNWLLLKNVAPTSKEVVTGDTIAYTAQVENVGQGGLTAVTVGLYESNVQTPLDSTTIGSVAAGGTADASIQWDTTGRDAGKVELFIAAGADGQVTDEDDTQSVNVTIRNPIVLASATPASEDNIAGTLVSINVQVLNESNAEVNDVAVKLDVVEDCEKENGCATIAAIAAGEKGAAVLEWDTAGVAAGQHELKVIASLDDFSGNDNDERSFTITLRDPVHDVALTAATVNRSVSAIGQTLDVTATITNNGDVPVAVPVSLYLVTRLDQTTAAATATSPLIEPGSREDVTLTWDSTGEIVGTHTLRVSAELPGDTTDGDNEGLLEVELFRSAVDGTEGVHECVEDVQVKVTGVSDVSEEKRRPPNYQVGEKLRATYRVYNFSCQTDLALALTMSGPQDHAISDAAALCFSDCVVPFSGKADGEVLWTIPTLPALNDQPVNAAVSVASPNDFVDADAANNSAASTDLINIVHPEDIVVRLDEERGKKVSTRRQLAGPDFGTVNVRLVSVDPLEATVPFADETVAVTVAVANNGPTTEPVAVRFLWENQDGIAGEELHNHTLIIPAGQTKTESIAVPIGSLPPGSHRIKVELASAATNVSSENAPRHLELTRLKPLVNVDMKDVVVAPDVLMLGDDATVSLTVQNNSDVPLALDLELYLDDRAEPIARETIDNLAPDKESPAQIAWSVPASGKHLGRHSLRLSAVSEKYGAIAVWKTEVLFHIDAEIMEIRSSPADTAMQGEEVAIEVDVQNNGPATANIPVVVRLSSDATFTDDRRPPVPSQSSGTARFTWRTRDYKAAEHTIRAEVPSEHNIATGKKSMELPFRINPMVIQASIETVSPYPGDPFVGEPVYISVTVRNDGPVATRIPITLHFPPGGRQPETRKPHVHPGQTETETFEWRTGNYPPGTHRFRI